MLHRCVAEEIARLAPANARVLVAVSGGPDSQALLHALAQTREVIAAGIDHGLRNDAARELDLAEALASRLSVPFVRRSVEVKRGNVMNEARKARYAALSAIATEHAATFIALAHTASDQLEQTLLELVRNNGAHGIRGIPKKRGKIIRPLLTTTRDEVLAYLDAHGIAYATDPSNSDTRRSRARLRHEVVPVLKALNPGIERTISAWTTQRARDERLLDRAARRHLARHTNLRRGPAFAQAAPHIALSALRSPLGERTLSLWLEEILGIVPRRRLIERIMAGTLRAAPRVRAAEGLFHADGETLWFIPKTTNSYAHQLTVPGTVDVAQTRITATLGDPPADLRSSALVAFDADDLQIPLVVRAWQAGDRFVPFQQGRKAHSVKVSDLFINAKVPRALRSSWPVVIDGDRIIWVVGLRRSNVAPITASTRRAVTLAVLA